MNTTEHDTVGFTVDEAIRISKIIRSVSEERIPILKRSKPKEVAE